MYIFYYLQQTKTPQNQKLEVYEYARKNDLNIDSFIKTEVSSHKAAKSRRIKKLLR